MLDTLITHVWNSAPYGQEWVGRYENNQDAAHAEQNEKILKWVQKLLKKAGLPQDRDIDFTDFARLVLRRRYDYVTEGREADLKK